jgi:hypothetical protein
MDRQTFELLQDFLVNDSFFSRQSFTSKLLDPRRSIDDECGYKVTSQLTIKDYQELYDREAVATRVVQVLPSETWKVQPTVYEDEDPDRSTVFEKAWDTLGGDLLAAGTKDNWYHQEEGSPIWSYLERLDVLSGIGRFGVLLLGVDDGKNLSEPIEPKDGTKLLYVQPFSESSVTMGQRINDPSNARHGKPDTYDITFDDPSNAPSAQGVVARGGTHKVHWTRVIHVADNCGGNDLLGVPRLRPVYNPVMALRKIYGTSGEGYFRAGIPLLSLESHPGINPQDIDVNTATIRTRMEQLMNGLQRWMLNLGLTMKAVGPNIVDPTPHIDGQITAICIQIPCPKRIFMGSERGELSSGQDIRFWNTQLVRRQSRHATPAIIVPLVNRLIWAGCLPEPTDGFRVKWPELETLTPEEEAAISLTRTKALAEYVRGDVESVVPPLEYLTGIMGIEDKEAKAWLKAALKIAKEETEEQEGEDEEWDDERQPDDEEHDDV